MHRPITLDTRRDACFPDVQAPGIDLVHVGDVTVAIRISEDDAGADGVMALAKDIGRDLELLVNDGVDRQLTALDLGTDVVDGDAPETTQRGTTEDVDGHGCRIRLTGGVGAGREPR